jgi:hypothetical protein
MLEVIFNIIEIYDLTLIMGAFAFQAERLAVNDDFSFLFNKNFLEKVRFAILQIIRKSHRRVTTGIRTRSGEN